MQSAPGKKEHKKVLIVEQEDHTRELLTSIIKLSGYEYHIAANVDEALKTLEQTTFDLLITDFTLPESRKLIESTQQKLPHLRSICLVRHSRLMIEAYSISGAVFVSKPFRLEEMIKKIHQAIHEKNLQEINAGFDQLRKDVLRMFG